MQRRSLMRAALALSAPWLAAAPALAQSWGRMIRAAGLQPE